MPHSPYIDRIKQAIVEASDASTKGVSRALLAGGYARLGSFEAAEAEISSLRAEFGDGRSGRVSIMIMCAEAQLIYYKNLGDQARDRMMRAQILSVASRDASLSALTSAWLAHICFNLHRHDEMARSVKTCLDTISVEDHEAASRLALTLGDAFYAAEQPEIGNRWYAKAHERAVKLGDHSVVAALTYNRAAMGTFLARLRAVDAAIDPDSVARHLSEVRSAVNYQAIAQLTSLQALLDYSLASVHLLADKHAEATAILDRMVASQPNTSPIDRSLVLRCDLALCLAKLGRLEEASACVGLVPLERLIAYTPDDQVVALSALAEAALACGRDSDHAAALDALSTARDEHRAVVDALQGSLASFSETATLLRI